MKKLQNESSGFSIGIDKSNIRKSLEETIKKQFSISEETIGNHMEEVDIDVHGFKKLSIVFHWKRIWQCDFIELNNEKFKIPFQVAVGVTFDQVQCEEG